MAVHKKLSSDLFKNVKLQNMSLQFICTWYIYIYIYIYTYIYICINKIWHEMTQKIVGWLVGWFYDMSTFAGYLTPNRFLCKSLSSSCRAASTDIPDPLSSLLPIIHRLWQGSGLHPVSYHSCWMYVLAGRPAFARPYVGVNRSTSLMSSSLLLQQSPACLVRLD